MTSLWSVSVTAQCVLVPLSQLTSALEGLISAKWTYTVVEKKEKSDLNLCISPALKGLESLS